MLSFVSMQLLCLWVLSSARDMHDYNISCHPCTCSIHARRFHADCEHKNLSSVPLGLPGNISSLNLAFNRIQALEPVNRYKNLKFLNVSYNQLNSRLRNYNLNSLESLDLSANILVYITFDFHMTFPSLKYLNISHNFVSSTKFYLSYNPIQNLEILDLSHNKIEDIWVHLFVKYQNLNILIISNNLLSSWNADMKILQKLHILDVSWNKFTEVPLKIREQLSVSSNLSIFGNPLKCTCETIASFKWMLENKHRLENYGFLQCQTESFWFHTSEDFDKILSKLEKTCKSYVGTMFGILSASMLCLGLMISALLYKYRWKLRYLYYAARIRQRGYAPIDDRDQFEYDAFISYADEDRELVVGEMRRRLEDTKGLKLCIHHRDFLPGNYIADNILNAVKTSRKTVLMLSKNFLKSKWCKYEAEMARIENIYTERKILLVVVLENIPVKDLTADIVELMHNDSYVEYTEDEEGREVFWDNLYRGITT